MHPTSRLVHACVAVLQAQRTRVGLRLIRLALRCGTALALLCASSAMAQPPARSDSNERTAPAAPRHAHPDFRNLRFDEDWTEVTRSRGVGDAIKAMPVTPGGALTLTLGGQVRWREEFVRGFTLRDLDDDHSQSRLLVSADLRVGRGNGLRARAFVEGRDAQSYGRTLPGGAGPSDKDRHDVQNLFGEVGYGPSFLRLGRQEIAINRERMFGVPDWANTRRGSQGTHLQLTRGALTLELLDVRPVVVRQILKNRADTAARVHMVSVGSSASAVPLARGLPAVWQGYVIEQRLRAPASATKRVTVGGRTVWRASDTSGRHQYSLELESAIQRGSSGINPLRAWFWVAEFSVEWRRVHGVPSLALGVEEASGERSSSPTVREGFVTLYPAAHAHGGYADVIGRTNMREVHLIGTWAPLRTLSLRGAAYHFTRLSLEDGAWTKQNTVFRAADGSTARHVADEVDLTGSWRVTRHLVAIAGGAVLRPGAFLTGTAAGARTERWSFVGSAFTF